MANRQGPGNLAMMKVRQPSGKIALCLQMEDLDHKPLAFMEMTKDEAVAMVKHLRESIYAIWEVRA